MLKKSFRYKILLSDIALTVLVFVIVVFVTYWQANRANSTAARVNNTLEILFHKEILVSLATDQETASRAYLLTGQEEFLETFQNARKNIPKEIATLQNLTAASVSQRRLADSLARYLGKRSAFVDSVLAQKLTPQQAVNLLITGQGKSNMDDVRRMLARFHAAENNLYSQYISENEKALSAQYKIFAGVVFFVLLVIVFYSLREKRRALQEERIQSENLLRNERRFRALVENNENIISLIGTDYQTYYRSPSTERITGWTNKERDEMRVGEQNHPDDQKQLNEVMKLVMAHPGKAFPVSLRTRHKLGGWVWLEGYFTNMFGNPDVNAIIVNLRDVTEEKRSREEIKQLNEELEEKVARRTDQLQAAHNDMEAFTYSVSHDLRAPLRIINGFTVILEEDYVSKLDDEAKRLMGVIRKNTTKMGNLIDGLLEFSRLRLQDVNKAWFSTQQMVDDIVRTTGEHSANKIEWVIHPLPQTWGDVGSIRQVWTNLISNAVKYSSGRENPRVEIGAFEEEDNTVFVVKDNGVGFDASYKKKLFKVFQRLHSAEEFEGTGIGLAVVQKVVSKHGGKVWAEGELGKGAAFYFSLPNEYRNVNEDRSA